MNEDYVPNTRRVAFDTHAVTPNDDEDLPHGPCSAVMCMTAGGDIAGIDRSGAGVVLTQVPIGVIVDHCFRRINSTGTTAEGVYALY